MTELEKMMRAYDYVRKLADGIDPLTDEELPLDSTYNNVRLSRCMYYVSEILSKVIANGGEVGRRGKKRKAVFVLGLYDTERLKPHTEALPITYLVNHLQQQLGDGNGKLSRSKITAWLLKNELLTEVKSEKGTTRIASEYGITIGMENRETVGKYGNYTSVYYNTAAQQVIIDALANIFAEPSDEE